MNALERKIERARNHAHRFMRQRDRKARRREGIAELDDFVRYKPRRRPPTTVELLAQADDLDLVAVRVDATVSLIGKPNVCDPHYSHCGVYHAS